MANVWRIAYESLRLQTGMSPVRLEARLRALVRHAYTHVRYYRHLMNKSGIRPSDIRTMDDFTHNFPSTHSVEYRSIRHERGPRYLIDQRLDPALLKKTYSSGSTGIPAKFFRSSADVAHNAAKTLRHLVLTGLRPWHRTLAVVNPCNHVIRDSALQRFGMFQRHTVHALIDPREVIEIIRRKRINAIYGNVACLTELADHLQGEKNDEMRIEILFPGTARINENTRRYLCETFHAKNYAEYYGTTETGIVARRVDNYYHPDFTSIFFDIKDPETDGPYTRGSILLTSLRFQAQPILNLEIGDIVTVENYNNHRRLRTRIVSIDGRDNDFLVLENGQRISGTFFSKLLDSFDFVRQFQVVQRHAGHCEILLRLAPGRSAAIENVDAKLHKFCRGRFAYKIHNVDYIPLQPNGKRKILISKLNSKFEYRCST